MSAALHPRLAELSDYLEACRADVVAAVESLPADARDRRPSPDGWSAAEHVEHLWLVEQGSAKLLHKLFNAAGELPPEASTESVLGALDRWSLVDNPARYPAPEMVAPRQGLGWAEALASLAASREILRAFVEKANGRDLTRLRAPHPRFGELTAYEWMLFIGQHEARHARQIRTLAHTGE